MKQSTKSGTNVTRTMPIKPPAILNNGGEGGIRTLGTVSSTHPFQGCTIGHSVTSPLEGVDQIIPHS